MSKSAQNNSEQHRLLTAEREQAILERLRQTTVLTVAQLARDLAVSEATVRRDLQTMDERKLLQRVHGGATLQNPMRVEPLFQDKQSLHPEGKDKIALRALDLIEDHDVIYLDGGSTVLSLARLLDRRRDLTVVTNSLMAAATLMTLPHRLILVGGEFRPISRTLVGPLTASVIQSVHVNKAFMGTIGFTFRDGMTTTDPQEAFTKGQIMQRANQVILLVDGSKLGVPSFARSGSPSDVDVLITDHLDPQFRTELEQFGIEVIIAT